VTAAQFTSALASLGLTQAGAARMLGVDKSAVFRWTKGDRPVPPPVARFLLYMRAKRITPDEVMRALS
jgi:transcriptional regulator with XRE-family HTH domain